MNGLNVFKTACLSRGFLIVLGLAAWLISQNAFAEAGRVVFAYGNVTAESPGGITRVLYKRDEVNAGEIIRTSGKSLVQIRMIDKGFIALRANSEVKIESYSLGVTKEEDVGIFSLIKGGLRAVTGIIGKRLRSAYRMRTVNATIGIRGTDYTARICNQDCDQGFAGFGNQVDDGLYVGVNAGGINLTNDLGTLDLDQLQYGYVKNATTAPVALASAPEFLQFNSSPPNPDDQADNSADSDNSTVDSSQTLASRTSLDPPRPDLNNDREVRRDMRIDRVQETKEQLEQLIENPKIAQTDSGEAFSLNAGAIESSRMIAVSYGRANGSNSIAATQLNPYSVATINQQGLQSFINKSIGQGVGQYSPGTTSTINLGFDPSTGIAWGRWYNGQAGFQNSNGSSVLDMTSTSLHWVAGPDQVAEIALPSSGIRNFNLVGNTDPTDNFGNIGVLGDATLTANFNNRTVDTSVAVGINGQVWNGSGSGYAISGTGGFGGALDTVQVNTGTGSVAGTGSTAGFITNNATGAAMGFTMDANINSTATTVNGTAVFQR